MRARLAFPVVALLAGVFGCGKGGAPPPLERVAELPAPSVPAWISQIAPVGSTTTRAQIRVIFASPVLPVEQIGSPGEQNVLSHVHIAPALPGSFVVLTPRMIGFQGDAQLPAATRIRVTLDAGLQDLQAHRLDRDLAWTFNTPPLRFTLPQDAPTPGIVSLKPVIQVAASTPIDPATFAQHSAFISSASSSIAATAVLESPPETDQIVYDVSPQSPLQRASAYRLSIAPGVLPQTGNLPSQAQFNATMTTYSPLAFVNAAPTADPLTSTGQPRFTGGDPALTFNNALDPKTYAQHVRVRPSPAAVGEIFSLSDSGNAILVNPYALAPQTAYTFTFDPQLQDVFGQQLEKAVSVPYQTQNYAPYFWAPGGANMFVSTQNLQLQYNAINLSNNRYQAQYRALSPPDLANVDSSSTQLLAAPKTWQAFTIGGALRNHPRTIDVPLREKLRSAGGVLAYGATASIAQASPYYGSVQLTNLGIFAQWFPQSGSIMVQRLSDGSPVASAKINVYVSHIYDASPAPALLCASGETNAQGALSITGTSIERCYAGNHPADQAPQLYIVAHSGTDWAYVRTFDWSGVYTYSSQINDTTWSAGQPISRGTIFSDRDMYQPGERGWFTAVCYVLQNGALRADRNAKYTIVLRDPNGKEIKLPAQTTNSYATFAFPIAFTGSQALGYYTIVATSPGGAQITGSFRVAQFRPPNFSVNLRLDRAYAAAGDSVKAQGSAQYLFGAPMTGAANVHVTREQTSFTPQGWDDYTFGRQWFWPDQQPEVSAEAGQQRVNLDAQGNASAAIDVAKDLPYAMTYRVDLDVSDVSHLTSSATQTFSALPSASLIGLRSDFVGTVNKQIAISVVVTDPQGKAQPGTPVHVELQKMAYSGVTQVVEGSEAARNQVHYTTVAQADLTSASRPQQISLQTKDSGSYRIRATFPNSSDLATATDAQVWVTGPGQAAWGQENPSQLQLKLDKQTYAAGDTAQLAVASPYEKADLYVSVVRDRVLYKTLLHVNGNAPRVRIPISQAMFPNAAVQGVLVRRGAPISGANALGVDSLVRIGMIPISLDVQPQYLAVKISSARARLEPHTQQTVAFHVSDRSGHAVKGQLTVIVANDAILQLSGYRAPDLVKIVLRDQPIATRFADNRPDVTLAQPSDVAQKGWGYGGGFLAGAAGTRVRTQFLPLAYFNGAVQTDASGNAHVTFMTPDNLTTWRVMAVALTADSRPRFGTSDTTFITTKPLVTDPLLPAFARPGDRFDAGLLLMNATTSPVDARTQALLSGVLSFATPAGERTQAQQQFGPGQNAWRFPMIVNAAGTASMQFTTTIGAAGSDAFRVPLEIRTADVSESSMDAGATQTQTSVPVAIGPSGGTVRVAIAGSLVPQAVLPAKNALAADKIAMLTPIADRLGIAASLLDLQKLLGTAAVPIDAASEASSDVTQLAAMQRLDGGFSFWPGSGSSDAFGTARAIRTLAYARSSGVRVPQALFTKAKPYLVRTLGDPAGVAKWCTSVPCKTSMRLAMLEALAAAGDRRTDFLTAIYAQRSELGIAERAELALYLQQTPQWRTQATALANELQQDVYITGRYANIQTQGTWYGSLVEAQAAYLRLAVAQNAAPAEQDRALNALVAQQCKCGWPGSGDTSAALNALVAYAAAQRAAPNFTATVVVDGKPAGTVHFSGFEAPGKTFTFDTLSRGSHSVTLRKQGAGTLHYMLAYNYSLDARSPGRISGLRVRRTVRPANASDVLATMDLAPQSLSLPAGNVYDVGVEVITDHPVDRVIVTDPLPAGFEALDTSFQTTAAYYQPLTSDWQIDYQQIYTDRVTAFAQHLDPGVYSIHYLVRSVTPGDYLWPGTSAYLLSAPEQFGRSAFAAVHV